MYAVCQRYRVSPVWEYLCLYFGTPLRAVALLNRNVCIVQVRMLHTVCHVDCPSARYWRQQKSKPKEMDKNLSSVACWDATATNCIRNPSSKIVITIIKIENFGITPRGVLLLNERLSGERTIVTRETCACVAFFYLEEFIASIAVGHSEFVLVSLIFKHSTIFFVNIYFVLVCLYARSAFYCSLSLFTKPAVVIYTAFCRVAVNIDS